MEQTDKNKITPRTTDFSEWYLDVIREGALAENSPVRGSMVIKPYGYSLWENIQSVLDKTFKKTGVQNAYFPLLIPKSFLEREAEHVSGFAKECAVVTHHRLEEKGGKLVPAGELEEPYVIRPTSETIIYDTFSRWIESYRDLPLLINQWANVVRWEMRTRPFLRTTEFLWQEGHTAHATEADADAKTLEMIRVYEKFVQDYLAISVVVGKKTEPEKFAGAVYTTTIEALMQDGKALQSGTSHMLGQNFAKSFDVSFVDENQQKQFAWQTSWGVSTRIIGALIMAHGDDKGIVLPPMIAPIQVVIIPIFGNTDDEKLVMDKVAIVKAQLDEKGIRYHVDAREGRPGFKYFEWERKGVPLRLEIGPKDVAKGSVVLVDRLTATKNFVADADFLSTTVSMLDTLQKELLARSVKFREDNTKEVSSYGEFKSVAENNVGFILAPLCADPKCEDVIKEETGLSTRCVPLNQEVFSGACVHCGKECDRKVLFAKAY